MLRSLWKTQRWKGASQYTVRRAASKPPAPLWLLNSTGWSSLFQFPHLKIHYRVATKLDSPRFLLYTIQEYSIMHDRRWVECRFMNTFVLIAGSLLKSLCAAVAGRPKQRCPVLSAAAKAIAKRSRWWLRWAPALRPRSDRQRQPALPAAADGLNLSAAGCRATE